MGTLRLTGGTLRSRSVKTPAGRGTRPTPARVKEALFSILADRVAGAAVLDLFAGIGALGFEVAEADLRIRNAGVLAGTTQAGANDTVGNIVDDFALYMQAKGSAEAIVSEDPELAAPEHLALRALIDDVAAARALLVTA